MKRLFKVIFLIIVSWGIYIPLTVIFFIPWIFNAQLNFLLGVVTIFFITYLFRANSKSNLDKTIRTLIIFIPICLFSLFYIIRGRNSFLTIPNYIIAPVLGMIIAIFYERFRGKIQKFAVVSLGIVICSWIVLRGFFIWGYMMNFGCLGTTYERAPEFKFENDTEVLTNDDLKGEVNIILFWDTIRSFNDSIDFDKAFYKWKDNRKVKFLSVEVMTESDTNNFLVSQNRVDKNDFYEDFKWKTSSNDYKRFFEDTLPKLVIINKRGRVVYKGRFRNIDDVIKRATIE